jgi:transcriptional regulator with GAF, ATPase, and Fis domain
MDLRSIVHVLGAIADTASETLELQEVFDRVATSVGELIPFDNMGVVRILEGERAVVHATTVRVAGGAGQRWEPLPLTSWSPRIRPRPGPIPPVEDAAAELDPAFQLDADILKAGVRSSLWEPFRSRQAFTGGIWLSSYTPGAFTDAHQEMLRPIAALLGSAVEHWRIWDAERRRRERLDRLESLLGTLAGALDVREVFAEVSAAVRPILAHDVLVLTELDEGARTFRVAAFAGEPDGPEPAGPVPLTEEESQKRLLDFEIIDDMPAEIPPVTERNRVLLATGMRSWLRVPVRLWGEVRGSLGFLDREPGRYQEADVEVARRLADRIALALSHHRLAEEASAAAAERERAERLEATVATLARELEARERMRIVGDSPSWKEILRQVGRVAASETTVLITGESGTGKELVSRLIHQGSPRAAQTFVAINCAALPEQLLESELFGHEKGAFTGALAAKIGRLEQAAGGTLFLDEIGEMSPLVQAKLLRVLEQREFHRLGGIRPLKADVRVIAATNRDLAAAMARGQFREDLFYRLAVFEIALPPLRERPEDILELAEVFLEDLGRTMGRPAAGISRDARDWILAYPWPGNVRELRNAIERAILLCDGGLITRDHLPAAVGRPEPARPPAANGAGPLAAAGVGPGAGSSPFDPGAPLPPGGVDLDEVERTLVEKALRQTRGNKSKASRLLGLSRAQLYSRLDKYGLR